MRKPLIAIPAKLNRHYGASVPYMEYLEEFGNVIILGNNDETINNIDMLVLPGGADVNPQRYGEKTNLFTGAPDRFLERFDTDILPLYIENLYNPNNSLKMILGICRGMQTLNVHFGGSLYQDVHNLPYSDPRSKEVETSSVMNLKDHGISAKTHKHNSLHHQAVKNLGKGLVATMVGQKKGVVSSKVLGKGKPGQYYSVDIIEGFRHSEVPLYGFQYHPEEMYCSITSTIIQNHLY